MIEATKWIRTEDGEMDTYTVRPEGDGPFPGVVMYQYAGGVTEALRSLARRVAENGYYCAVPNLYYRLGQIASDPENLHEDAVRIRRIAASNAAVPFRAMEDTKSLLESLDRDPTVDPGFKGSIGFCQGGFHAALAAGTFPETFRASICLFATRLLDDRPDVPHRFFDRVKGEIHFGFAEFDDAAPLSLIETYREFLEKSCTAKWSIEVHEGTQHGYTFPNRHVYNAKAAERSWETAFSAFGTQLGKGA